MYFDALVQASRAVSSTSGRRTKVARLAEALRDAEPAEVPIVVAYLSGELRQRRTGVGWAALRDLPAPATEPTLEVAEVDTAFEKLAGISGTGSTARRREVLTELWGRATADEQRMLGGLIGGELRQGALDGLMIDAVITASGLEPADVRRAVMLAGSVAPVAIAALTAGRPGDESADGGDPLAGFRLRVGEPVRPMLASPAPDMAAAFEKVAPGPDAADTPPAVEWKLDGIRVQIHRDGREVRILTRTLDEVTARMPEIVEAVLALPVSSAVLDGEVIALDADERPRPFQVTASRVGSRTSVDNLRATTPLRVFLFDALHLGGVDLIGDSASKRWAALAAVVPDELRVPHLVTGDVEAATAFFEDAIARGHEGVVVKSATMPYDAGRRGSSWIKVKPRHTLDLVVLAVEWGHGRRTGLLSNLHLGARDPETGGFVMLGKTFKGLTDAMLRWQTERLLALEDHRDGWVVYVRPELVVEIAFDGVQTSSRYPGGMALRFARVIRYREDKTAAEADTVGTVRELHGPARGVREEGPE